MRRLTLLTLAVGSLAGCAQPVLLKHYKIWDTQIESNLADPDLVLSVFPAPVKAPDSTPIALQLEDKAQGQLVQALAGRVPPSADASAAAQMLAAALMTSPSQAAPCAWAERSTVTRRLNITLLGNMPKPADRVDKLEIRLRVQKDAKASFSSWDRFDSAYVSYNFGSATYTQSNKLTAGTARDATDTLSDGAGSVLKKLSLGAEHSNSLAETASYAARRMTIGGSLAPGEARLVMEGGPLTNLIGTSNATVTLKLTPGADNWPVYKLDVQSNGKPEPQQVSVLRCQVKALEKAVDLTLDVTGRALVRQVVEGDDTVTESDDKAYYRQFDLGASTKPVNPQAPEISAAAVSRGEPLLPLQVPLISAVDTTFDTFGLRYCRGVKCQDVHIDGQGLGSKSFDPLQFAASRDANAFRLWLLARADGAGVSATSVGGRAFGLAEAGEDANSTSLTVIDSAIARQLQVVQLCTNNARNQSKEGQRCDVMK